MDTEREYVESAINICDIFGKNDNFGWNLEVPYWKVFIVLVRIIINNEREVFTNN